MDSNSTWGQGPIDIGGVRDFVTGLQDAQRARREKALKSVERAVLAGLGTWGLLELRKKSKK